MAEVHHPEETSSRKKGFFSRMADNLQFHEVVLGAKSLKQAEHVVHVARAG